MSSATDVPSRENHAGPDAVVLDKLLSVDQSAILKLIEDLRPITKYDIDLPRIIVCGDQSCGKSSVLEAISRLSFPREETLCTTFATELILNQQNTSGVTVNILWDDPGHDAEEFRPKNTSVESLSSTINEAKRIMERHNEQQGCAFFKDVLQVRASNPSWPPLSLVDLPGLIHSGKGEQDLKVVREITKMHMMKPNTIILAVVSASNDPENQEILKMVEECDPDGKRTMGIITKPDRVGGPITEQRWINLAKRNSQSHGFGHGWHVVKNRGSEDAEVSFDERDENEQKFFNGSNWRSKLEPEQLGIDNLRVKISKILEDHIRHALPGIILKLESKLEACSQKLEDLGPSRVTLDDQRNYLTRIGTKFEKTIEDAVYARYNTGYNTEFFAEEDKRLCAIIRTQNDEFVEWMYGWGHTFELEGYSPQRKIDAPKAKNSLSYLNSPKIISRAEFVEEIKLIQMGYRGNEPPGMCNPEHLTLMFRKQSQRWRTIAEFHLKIIWDITRRTMYHVAHHAAGKGNNHTASALLRHIIYPKLKNKQKIMQDKLNEILRPHEILPVMTYDPEFVQKQDEMYRRLRDGHRQQIQDTLARGESVEVETFVKDKLAGYELEKREFPSDSSQILDLVQLYYRVRHYDPFIKDSLPLPRNQTDNGQNALRTFIDNVISLAIANCLVLELPSLFNVDEVNNIAHTNKPLLDALAGEPEDVRIGRMKLEQEQKELQKGLDDCREQLGDINPYSVSFAGSPEPSPAYVSVAVLSPEPSNVVEDPTGYRSAPSTPERRHRSRGSSNYSATSTSTVLTVPSPERSVSGRDTGRKPGRVQNIPPKLVAVKAQQYLSTDQDEY
jgi:GTPase SAR1 family protein